MKAILEQQKYGGQHGIMIPFTMIACCACRPGHLQIHIYCIQNVHNQRRYIGSTVDLQRRYAEHRRHPPNRMATDAASFTPFDDCFQMTRLATVESKRKAKEAEYFWIRHYDTQNSSRYNICKQDPTIDKRFWFLRRLAALG